MTTTQERPTHEESRESRHGPLAQLLIAWSPLSVILVAYALAGWVAEPIDPDGPGSSTNRLGMPLHVAAPARVDEHLFGAVPSVWLQARLVDGSPHWYDAVAALVYLTHFVTIPVVTALVWFTVRDRFAAWLAAVMTFTAVGVGGYLAYPAAPPWMASDLGVVGTVRRISDLGLEYLHLGPLDSLVTSGQAGSNPVAAMPSMHAGSALLVCLFLWPLAGRVERSMLGLYVGVMALTLVYTGEHYVADVMAGWAVTGVAVAAGRLVRSLGPRPTDQRASPRAQPAVAPSKVPPGDAGARRQALAWKRQARPALNEHPTMPWLGTRSARGTRTDDPREPVAEVTRPTLHGQMVVDHERDPEERRLEPVRIPGLVTAQVASQTWRSCLSMEGGAACWPRA